MLTVLVPSWEGTVEFTGITKKPTRYKIKKTLHLHFELVGLCHIRVFVNLVIATRHLSYSALLG